MVERSTKLRLVALLCVVLFSCVTEGVYEDEVGVYDWAQFNIGCVTSAEFSNVHPHIFVVTDQGAVAALDSKTGELVWRQILPNGAIADKLVLFNNDKHLITITNEGTRAYLWRAVDGGLMWEQEISTDYEGLQGSADSIRSVSPQIAIAGHEVAILSNNSLFLISLRSGNILWNAVRSPEGKVIGLTSKKDSIYVVVQEEKHLVGYKWDTETGAFHLLKDISFPSGSKELAIVSLEESIIFGSSKKICVFDASQTEEKFACRAVGETSSNVGDSIVLEAVQSLSEERAILVSWAKGGQNNLYRYSNAASFSKVEEFSNHDNSREFFASASKGAGFFARTSATSSGDILELFFAESGRRKYLQLPVQPKHQGLVKSVFMGSSNPSQFLIVCEDDSLSLIDEKTSSVLWKREESLATIKIAKFMEIPSPVFDEQVRHTQGILQQFIRRISAQFEAFENFLVSELQHHEVDVLEKDRFGFNKLILMAARTGKLFCLSNHVSHPIIWAHWFSGETIEDIILTHLGSTDDSTFLAITKDRITGLSSIYTISLYTGAILTHEQLDYTISHSLLFPQKDSTGRRILLITDDKQQAHVFPNTAEAQSIVALLSSSTYDFQINAEIGIITGFQFQENLHLGFLFSLEEHWRISLSDKESIIAMERLSDTHIHSAIRLMPDNTALPKYINRNLIAVATLAQEEESESINVYLLDSVTGSIIHHVYHPHTSGPLHLLLCENFLVYSYWNKKTYRTEVSVVELFEKQVDWSSTSFSSFSGIQPEVYQQSFEVTFFITSLGITQTRRGITTHNVLFGTQSGQLVSFDKRWVDPLRPVDEKIPGMIPYSPELTLFSKAVLSHTVQVERLENIISTSAHIESTSLVFVWGLDHFFTHVRPAEKFDMLSSDFDFISLFGTVGIILVLTSVSYSLQKKRKLMQQWK